MRGRAYYTDSETDTAIEFEAPPRKAMTDARFSAICRVVIALMVCVASVAAIWLAGTPAVIAIGFLSFFYIVFNAID